MVRAETSNSYADDERVASKHKAAANTPAPCRHGMRNLRTNWQWCPCPAWGLGYVSAMSVLRTLFSGLVIALFAACGGSGKGPSSPADKPAPGVTATIRAQLTIPPNEQSLAVMRDLEGLSDAGNAEAAILHAHYLMDLFDDARFAERASSRDVLAEIAGRPKDAMRGPAATQALAELLVLDADRILELDRKSRMGQELRVLASYDAVGPANRGEVFQAMQELKRIRDKDGPLAANANLRLFGYCRSALLDAQRFDRAGQRIALSHCLYPLYSSDPEPYFAEHSEERPPPPDLAPLASKMRELASRHSDTRLGQAFASQKAWIENYSKAPGLVSKIDPLALRLPTVAHARPYDDAPILGADASSLGSEVLADGRGQVAIAFASERPATDVLKAAETISEAGADTALLLVATSQRLRVPKGDYWSRDVGDAPILRAGQIAFSLARLESTKDNPKERSADTKAAQWNAQHSDLTLHLLVSPSKWTLASPLGRIAEFAVGDKDASAPEVLQKALVEVRKAYPDEQGIILVPEPGTSVGALALAAEAAHHRPDGMPLFPRLAIASKGPKVRKGNQLAVRIARRALASISVDPEILSSKVPVAMRCYHALANTNKLKSATVRLELPEGGRLSATGGNSRLQACAKDAFAPLMKSNALRAAEVQFSATGK